MKISTLAASVAAIAVAGAATLGAAPANAATPSNPQLDAARTWLVGQLQDGLLPSSYGGANYGASADAIMSLVAIGDSTDADPMAQALASQIDSYISGDDQDPSDDADADQTYEDVGSTYAGSVAKAYVALTLGGVDTSAVMTHLGGKPAGNLISRLEAQVQPSGRIQDTSTYGDYENVLGQSFAVDALTEAGSTEATSAATFLLSQQCSAGWFRQSFDQTTDANGNPLGTDESCDADPASTPSVDATATALTQLAPQVDDGTASAAVTSAVDKAKAWLLSVQAKDGGWSDGGAGDPENANSTGLAATALGRLDPTNTQPAGAVAAASWVGARELENVGRCTPYATGDLGALAYDGAAWTKAQKTSVGTANDQFIVAASQALPALVFVDDSPAAPSFLVSPGTSTADLAPAGSTRTFDVSGMAGPRPACVSDSRSAVLVPGDRTAATSVRLKLRATTGTETVTAVPADGTTARTTVTALAATKLRVSAPKSVARGHRLRVVVSGLAKNERVTIELRGNRVAAGFAKSRTFRRTFTVRAGRGRAAIKVVGQFSDRRGSTTVTVK